MGPVSIWTVSFLMNITRVLTRWQRKEKSQSKAYLLAGLYTIYKKAPRNDSTKSAKVKLMGLRKGGKPPLANFLLGMRRYESAPALLIT